MLWPCVVEHPCIPVLGRLRQEAHHEFKTCLGYTVSQKTTTTNSQHLSLSSSLLASMEVFEECNTRREKNIKLCKLGVGASGVQSAIGSSVGMEEPLKGTFHLVSLRALPMLMGGSSWSGEYPTCCAFGRVVDSLVA